MRVIAILLCAASLAACGPLNDATKLKPDAKIVRVCKGFGDLYVDSRGQRWLGDNIDIMDPIAPQANDRDVCA